MTELVLYIAMLGMVAMLTIPLLFSSAENRMLQQTIAIVELNGTQAVQTITLHIRSAERILYPLPGASGSFLALQHADEASQPIIIGVHEGRMTIITRAVREAITSSQVAVQDLVVHNTSASPDRPSVALSFRVSRTIRLQQPYSYDRVFDAGIALSPVDAPVGNPLGCADPQCISENGSTFVRWQITQDGFCRTAETPLRCSP